MPHIFEAHLRTVDRTISSIIAFDCCLKENSIKRNHLTNSWKEYEILLTRSAQNSVTNSSMEKQFTIPKTSASKMLYSLCTAHSTPVSVYLCLFSHICSICISYVFAAQQLWIRPVAQTARSSLMDKMWLFTPVIDACRNESMFWVYRLSVAQLQHFYVTCLRLIINFLRR